MLDRLKQGVHRRAKSLSRHSHANLQSEAAQHQDSRASSERQKVPDGDGGEGSFSNHPAVHPLTAGPPAPRPATAHDSNVESLSSLRLGELNFSDSFHNFAQHPAIRPLTSEPSPRTPHLEQPHPSLSPSQATSSQAKEKQDASSSEYSDARSQQPPYPSYAIRESKVPARKVSTSKKFPFGSVPTSPTSSTQGEFQRLPGTRYTQLNGRRRWSNGSLVSDHGSRADEHEQTHHPRLLDEEPAFIMTAGDSRPSGAHSKTMGNMPSSNVGRGSTEEDALAHNCDICNNKQLHHKLSKGGEFCQHKAIPVNGHGHNQEDLSIEDLSGEANLSSDVTRYDRVRKYDNVDFDHTAHNRPAVTHEVIQPHVHTIYEPQRTRSIHYHEHKKVIQPILDPDPQILPEQHWAQDHRTGKVFRIPDELGKELSSIQ